MCGIAGIAVQNGTAGPEDREGVVRMMELGPHRRPDAQGITAHDAAVLGHRRLAILDLSDAGKQPMTNETGTVWVVFNGEIYNYPELRCEILLAGPHLSSR